MTIKELLINKLETLLPEEQEKVVEFINFLEFSRNSKQRQEVVEPIEPVAVSPLGEKLQKIRDKIVESGQPLLTAEEADREKAERRGGYQGD